jgi:outer membrane murein-binding lipoprotein Lpp
MSKKRTLLKLSAIALGLGLITGCAANKEMEALRADVTTLQGDVANAQSTADAAKATADSAAASAERTERIVGKCCAYK